MFSDDSQDLKDWPTIHKLMRKSPCLAETMPYLAPPALALSTRLLSVYMYDQGGGACFRFGTPSSPVNYHIILGNTESYKFY